MTFFAIGALRVYFPALSLLPASISLSFFKVFFLGGAQWLSGRVLDTRPRGRRFEPHRPQCHVSLSKNINPSLVLVQPRKTCPFITERLLMGRKESNQPNNYRNAHKQQKLSSYF